MIFKSEKFKPHPQLLALDEQVQCGLRGDFARGQEICDYLEATTPEDPRAAFNRAWYKMRQGDLLAGLKLLDFGRWIQVFGGKPLPTEKSIWKDENLEKKHLLLCCEGGLGDEIINVRFAEDFAELGARVTVACDPSLKSVFARMRGVSAVVNHRAAPEVYHDYWVPAMSAGRVLNCTNEALTQKKYYKQYLTSDTAHQKKWKDYFATKFSGHLKPRIGLRFYGNPKFEHEQHRLFPKELLIQAMGDRPWVSLQLEDTDLPIQSWEDTLAVINELDLVITSCTSVAHASAALGKPTWVISPILPYYIWALPGKTSPWYQSVRLFRQETYGDWNSVFLQIRTELESVQK